MKHRAQPSSLLSCSIVQWKRIPLVTQAAGTLLALAFLANFVALVTRTTEPAGAALVFAVVALVMLLIFQS